MSIQSKTREPSLARAWRENLEQWTPSRLFGTLKRLIFAASRNWRRRRAILGTDTHPESETTQSSGSTDPAVPQQQNSDEQCLADGGEPPEGEIDTEELDEESNPAQEVLDSGHTIVRMADVFDVGETEDFGSEAFSSDNWDADDWVPDDNEATAVSESLYEKLMRSCVDEDSASSDSSAELIFSPSEFERLDGGSLDQPVSTEKADITDGNVANAGEVETTAARSFVSEDDDVISGDTAPAMTSVYPAMPEGLLDAADSDEHQTADMKPPAAWDEVSEDDSPEQIELDYLDSGAVMNENTETNGSKHELAAASRMERLKPKSANSLTGAPPPKVDGRVEDSVLAPETEVLLVALHAPERNTFRTYLRRHDIPCRAAISAENAVAVVLGMKPAAVLISGSGMNPEEIITLVDDLNDMVDAPVLTLLTEPQINLLSNDPLSSHVLQYPASLRHIRTELTRILTEEGNAKPRCSLRSALMPE